MMAPVGRAGTQTELEAMLVEVAVFSLATHLYWAVWGILQARTSAVLPAPSHVHANGLPDERHG